MSTIQNFEKGVDYKCVREAASSGEAEKGEAKHPCNQFTGEDPKGRAPVTGPQMNFKNGKGS